MTPQPLKLLTMPPRVRAWLVNERLLTPAMIEKAGIRYGKIDGDKYCRIAIPNRVENGKVGCWKCRITPGIEVNKRLKWRFDPIGTKLPIFGKTFWPKRVTDVYRCEGELDCLLLNQHGFAAITSSTGVGSYIEECLECVPHGARFILVHDNDDAGKNAVRAVQEEVERKKRSDIRLYTVAWPEGFKKDVTDFALQCKKQEKEFKTELRKLLKPCEEPKHPESLRSEVDRPRVARITSPEQPLEAAGWQTVIKTHFPGLLIAAELAMSAICQILIKDISNPCAIILVDAPSAGKTIVINFFARCGVTDLIYHTDKFSPASFVSQAANVRKEDLSKVDLLPRIKHKLLTVCDMATIFSLRDDDLNAVFGILTRVLDGEGLSFDAGVHGQRSLVGDYLFMILAGSTEIPRRVWEVMARFGPRLFFFGLHTKEQTEEELVELTLDQPCIEKEKLCRKATGDFLRTLWAKHPQGIDWKKKSDEKRFLHICARCARFLARFRAIVKVDQEWIGDTKETIYTVSPIELPPRLNQLFYNVARGHAVYAGRDYLTDDDLRPVVLLACDSAPGRFRVALFHALIRHNGELRTNEIEKVLNCAKPTALHEMKILCAVGICEEWDPDDLSTEKGIRLKQDFRWFCSEECRSYLSPDTGSDSPNSLPE